MPLPRTGCTCAWIAIVTMQTRPMKSPSSLGKTIYSAGSRRPKVPRRSSGSLASLPLRIPDQRRNTDRLRSQIRGEPVRRQITGWIPAERTGERGEDRPNDVLRGPTNKKRTVDVSVERAGTPRHGTGANSGEGNLRSSVWQLRAKTTSSPTP